MSRGKHHEKFGNIEQQPAFNIYPPSQASTQQAIYHPLQASTQHRGGEDPQKELVENMKQQLEYASKGPFDSPKLVPIFRLPNWYHETNKHLYEPKMVAIGPFHNGKDCLRAMEDHKWYSLQNILDRADPVVSLEQYLDEMVKLEEEARNYYSEIVRMDKLNFARMLLLDGCFIIDYFEKLSSPESVDTICNVGWAKIHLYSDLFLLENQIPFFVIRKLITMRDGPNSRNDSQVLDLFRGAFQKIFSTELYPCSKPCKDNIPETQQDSVDLESRCCFPYHQMLPSIAGSIKDHQGNSISCVSELHEAGITFRKSNNPTNMLNILFKNGVMEMPFLKLQDTHKVILWNMVAFEQSQLHLYKSQILSSYLALMDGLINTEKDVAILEKEGVIENYLQTDEDAAELFNQFAKSFVLDYSNHHYKSLFLEIKRYSKSGWHKNRARLMHDYFGNPWKTISVIAAAILLLPQFRPSLLSNLSTESSN